MKAGEKDLAIKSLAKSLELDPRTRNAVDQLATLTKRQLREGAAQR